MIPVSEPLLGHREADYVLDCLKTNWISSKGKYIDEFEQRFADYCGCRFGISTTGGTTALHLALASLGIGPGDEVIVPTFTMISTLYAVVYTGAKPVLVDAEPRTYNMDVTRVEAKITGKTKALFPVHIYGHPCDMDPLYHVAKKYGLAIIEDAAEAHGAEYKGKRTGSLGTLGAFSFYANKIITTGEGGMVTTDDEALASRARRLKDLGLRPDIRFLHDEIAFNYRMTNLQAAVGLGQLEVIDDLVERRRGNARHYKKLLGDVPGLRLPLELEWAKNVYWMYSILIEEGFGASRDELAHELEERGVETRPFFIPMHWQPAFLKMGLFLGEHYPVAEQVSRKGLYLPSGPGLTSKEIEQVCHALKEVYHAHAN